MRNYIIAHQDKLTHFNDGAVLESQIEATARELALLYVRCRVGFSSFMRALPYSVFGFQKKEGLKASVKLTFSRAKTYSYETAIPIGTTVATGGLKFITTELGSVVSGAKDSGEISAVAEDIGEKYNVGAQSIKTLVSALPSDIVTVSNAGSATGGVDSEDWGAYINRFTEYILGLSRTNGYGFLSALTETHLVRSLQIDEHFPPLNNIWNMTVYLEDGSGGMTDDAITQVKAKIDGNRTKTNGGYRAPGIHIRYVRPEKIPISLNIRVTVTQDAINDRGESVVISEVTEAVKTFINGLLIGQSVLISDLIVVLRRMSYILDAQIPDKENMGINTHQIARFQSCSVTVVRS
ncbi:MAG: baseplate J/gp47 family protein [Proteiniphilum sp.]|nr:baseplate J/gp47 family protein [Proteiniphilum sp.]